MRFRSLVALGVLAAASGCLPDLGECDEDLARSVVYTADREGLPAYAGQALVHRSCGSGVFCHSERATGSLRNGAPFGLDFDLALASDAESTERLRRGQLSVYEDRRILMFTMENESMPPGEVGNSIRDAGPVYRDLPEIDTPEGQDILRNWLSCGAPVVERVRADRPMGTEPVGAIVSPMPEMPPCELTLCGGVCVDTMVSRNNCGGCAMPCADDELCTTGSCTPCAGMVSFAADVTPIFEANGCNSAGCHEGDVPSGGLDLTMGVAHASLVEMPSTCPDGRSLVSTGAVSGSYLMNKLLGIDMCDGGQMPLGTVTGIMGSEIQIIEAWICGGAAND